MENQKLKEDLADAIIETEEIKQLRDEISWKEDEIEENEDWEMDDNQLDDELDSAYGDVEIAGHKYSTSNALKNVDETMYEAFRQDMSEPLREQKKEELEEELEELKQQLNDLLGEDE